MARLNRLAPVKEVAQLGAALSREFAYELLAAVTPTREQVLHDALEQLVAVPAPLSRWMAVLFNFPSDPDPSPSEAPPSALLSEESNGLRGVTR
jgi:hypothetical protein